MANYTITAAWLDRETVKYSLNNNSIRPAWTGSNIENVSCTATTISFAQGQTIRVMTLDPVGGGVRVTSTTSRSIPRQQPVPPPLNNNMTDEGQVLRTTIITTSETITEIAD